MNQENIQSCIVVRNSAERVSVTTDTEGVKKLIAIHGQENVLKPDGTKFVFENQVPDEESDDSTESEPSTKRKKR